MQIQSGLGGHSLHGTFMAGSWFESQREYIYNEYNFIGGFSSRFRVALSEAGRLDFGYYRI